MEKSTLNKIEEYGEQVIAVVLDPINSSFGCVAIVQADELCNLDAGRELFRFKRGSKMPEINHNIELILTTPNCKTIADSLSKEINVKVLMLFNN